MRRAVVLAAVFVAVLASLVSPAGALAWSWPAEGPVLRPFSVGPDPYAGGQHRGIDIGAELGRPVLAPVGGTISFAGVVPGGGHAVTITTDDGYAVTLLQLGAASVARADAVAEGAEVGVVGESSDAGTLQPHVHLGVRVASDPNGYVDPLSLLPARPPAVVPPSPVSEPPVVAPPVAAPPLPAVEMPSPQPAPAEPATVEPVEAVALPTPAAEAPPRERHVIIRPATDTGRATVRRAKATRPIASRPLQKAAAAPSRPRSGGDVGCHSQRTTAHRSFTSRPGRDSAAQGEESFAARSPGAEAGCWRSPGRSTPAHERLPARCPTGQRQPRAHRRSAHCRRARRRSRGAGQAQACAYHL